MARVFRQQYTRPIPEGAERVTAKVKRRGKVVEVAAVRFKGDDGKHVVAPVVEKGRTAGKACRVASPTWYGRVGGKAVPLCSNKAAAEVLLHDLIRKRARGEAGMADPHEEHRKRPLDNHLKDWRAAQLAGGAPEKHLRQTVACVQRLLEGCGFTKLSDITDTAGTAVQAFLAGLRVEREVPGLAAGQEEFARNELASLIGVGKQAVTDLIRRHDLPGRGYGKARRYPRETAEALLAMRRRGRSVMTANLYLDGARAFFSWLAKQKRIGHNPLAGLKGGNVKADRRHDRRPLAADGLRSIIQSARESGVAFRGLSGPDRSMLYAVACATGFRAEELACLRPSNFDFTGAAPLACLGAWQTKNGKDAQQPLPSELVSALREYLGGRPADLPLWHGTWYQKAAEMLRIDLEAAGVPYVVEGPDGRKLYADFHACGTRSSRCWTRPARR
jgi:integrase